MILAGSLSKDNHVDFLDFIALKILPESKKLIQISFLEIRIKASASKILYPRALENYYI